MRVALVGNPNVGKTTILNALTRGKFIVGNYPGTTVEVKRGSGKIHGREVEFIDLPGIYGLDARAKDEEIVVEFLEKEGADLLLIVINANALERGLYLALRLSEYDFPAVIVLNMIDEAEKSGKNINAEKLEKILGTPVVKCIAVKNVGIDEIKRKILEGGKKVKLKVKSPEEALKMAEKIASEVTDIVPVEKPISLDAALTDKYLSIPIFFAVMWIVFRFTYDIAAPLVDSIDILFSTASEFISSRGGILFSLIGDGMIAGVGAVLVFLPNIVFLFIAISLLELSGYIPRVVFALDKIMAKFGLVGRSVVPLILGFGCNVPAILAARSIEDEKSRKITVLISPFISCSARLPIYVLFTSIFFPALEALAIMSLYVLGIAVGLFSSFILRRTLFKGEPEFIMEFPPLRLPRFRDILTLTWVRTKHFLVKAGTVILGMSIVVWFITNYPSGEIGQSYAGMLGKMLMPLFSPFGWGWELVVAIITGFVAKEVVVETLEIVAGDNLPNLLTASQAFSFMVFTLLYVPCMATIAAIRSELGWKYSVFSVIYSSAVAYVLAFAVYIFMEVVA